MTNVPGVLIPLIYRRPAGNRRPGYKLLELLIFGLKKQKPACILNILIYIDIYILKNI